MITKLLKGATVEWKNLEDLFDIFSGGDLPKSALSKIKTEKFNIPILSNGIGRNSLYGYTDTAKIYKPSLTISARGTIGWTSFRDKPFFPIVRLLVLTPKVKLNLKYIFYFMKSIEKKYKIQSSSIPQLTIPMIKNIEIPIPPLSVQVEIARILDAFTALTADLTAELKARKKQYNYYRDQLLRFKKGEAEWRTVEEIFELKNGYTPSKSKTSYWENGSIPWFRMEDLRLNGNVLSDAIQKVHPSGIKGKLFPANSIIMATTATIGEHALITVEYLSNQRFTNFTVKDAFRERLNIKFIYYYFFILDQKAKQDISTSSLPSVQMNKLKKWAFPIPPLTEQERIVSVLDKFDTLTTSITEGLPKEIALRQQQYEYYRDQLLNFPKA